MRSIQLGSNQKFDRSRFPRWFYEMRLENFLAKSGRLRVKICGITRKEDAEMIAESDCDAIGLNFYAGSSRNVSISQAEEIAKSAGDTLLRVAVTVNADIPELKEIWRAGFVDMFQFHGDETPAYVMEVQELGLPWYPAVRLLTAAGAGSRLETLGLTEGDLALLDGWSASAYGGTGHSIEEEELGRLGGVARRYRCFLAGGLTPENVRDRVAKFAAFGVDVASGVESSPGVKDWNKIGEFVKSARSGG